ncbi:MAG TPA: helix-turn-helix transcriptional regulator [Candidatus Polarisedimenticolia bacterium]|nr:helix-turn-helix transcriptional regulator [Candidatus Polarisedimenticolia bacterium]
MNFAVFVKSRLTALGYEQKDLARAAQVTGSYISQLLSRRKPPPDPERTDIYARIERFLRLESGELGRLVDSERIEHVKLKLGRAPEPLFQEFRDLVLGKCADATREEVRAVFERQAFGTLERLVAQKILQVVQGVAREELDRENWLRLAARVGGRSHEEMRVLVLEFLDTDVSQVSRESCVAFLDPLLESWDIDLESFRLDIRLNRRLVERDHRTFAFVEIDPVDRAGEEPGLAQFLEDPMLSCGATPEEVRILKDQRLGALRPTKYYYYRALQNLRDPLHFSREPR